MKIKTYISNDDRQMNYAVAFGDDYADQPLLIYLHGAGERGRNFDHIYRHGIPKLIKEGLDVNAVVLFPQCPESLFGTIWSKNLNPSLML